LALSPDGAQVVYTTNAVDPNGQDHGLKTDIVISGPDGTGPVTLVHDVFAGDGNFDPKLTFVSDHVVVDACQFSAQSLSACHRVVRVFDRHAVPITSRTVLSEDIRSGLDIGTNETKPAADRFALITNGGIASFDVRSGVATVTDTTSVSCVSEAADAFLETVAPGFFLPDSSLLYVNTNGLARLAPDGTTTSLAPGVKGISAITPDGSKALVYKYNSDTNPDRLGWMDLWIASTSTPDAVSVETSGEVLVEVLTRDASYVVHEVYDGAMSFYAQPVTGGPSKKLGSFPVETGFLVAHGTKLLLPAVNAADSHHSDLLVVDAASGSTSMVAESLNDGRVVLDPAGDHAVLHYPSGSPNANALYVVDLP
jgi:hypothetical protein